MSDEIDDSDDVHTPMKQLSIASGGTAAASRQRSRRKKRVLLQPQALTLLCTIPGNSNSLLCSWLHSAEILESSRESYKNIYEYVINGQEHGYGIKVENILKISRNKDFNFDNKTKRYRMMLWHGTKKACVASILEKGFKRPTTKAQMFGTGVYFADRASKSTNYSDATTVGSVAYLFLCDVDLGKVYKAKNAHNEYTEAPTGYNSVKCVGEFIPDWGDNKNIRGSILPSGKTKKNPRFPSYTVKYNEYVVYDPERIKPKYLVIVKFQRAICV